MAVPKKPVKKKPSPKKKARVAKRAEKKETRVAKRKVKKATRAEKNAPSRISRSPKKIWTRLDHEERSDRIKPSFLACRSYLLENIKLIFLRQSMAECQELNYHTDYTM